MMQNILFSGADKIIVNSSIYNNLDLIDEINENIGAQSIIISIDVKKIKNEYICFSHSGTKNSGFELMNFS